MSDVAPEPDDEEEGGRLNAVLPDSAAGLRLDKAIAEALPELSRARIQALMLDGAVVVDGVPAQDGSAKARPGAAVEVRTPPPAPAEPEAQDIPLEVLFEDEYLIVVNKPAGMAAHPAPGSPDRTLVNALLFHCRGGLSGIGGVARPGIVHRLDKDTAGVMVAAKTDAAHKGLSALFAAHDIERAYIAFTRGAPSPVKGTILTRIARSIHDRKKMAVVKAGGREAITHYRVERNFGPEQRPVAAKVVCRLETGRTHQIRVHLASKGAPCLGDPVYGSGAPSPAVREAIAAAGLGRQALFAAVLGFVHPVTGEHLRFEAPLPDDMARLETELASRLF